MNIEEKAKSILVSLILLFAIVFIAQFLYSSQYIFVGIVGLCMSVVFLVLLEMYLRVQHNIDRVNFRRVPVVQQDNSGLIKEIRDFKNEQKGVNQGIVEFLEKLLVSLESNSKDLDNNFEKIFKLIEEQNNKSKEISEFVKLTEEQNHKFEMLRSLVENRFDNNKIVQRKFSSAIEELLSKINDLK